MISITAKELCHLLNGELIGNPATKVTNFAKIEEANEGMLSFIANPKYEHFAATTNASVLLVSRAFNIPVKESITLIKVDEPYSALAFLLEMMQKMTEKEKTGIEANSFIAANSTHGENLYLAAF